MLLPHVYAMSSPGARRSAASRWCGGLPRVHGRANGTSQAAEACPSPPVLTKLAPLRLSAGGAETMPVD